MFDKTIDERLSDWAAFRKTLDTSATPFEDVWEYWKQAPYVPYNHNVDPFNQPQVENSKKISFNKRLAFKGLL